MSAWLPLVEAFRTRYYESILAFTGKFASLLEGGLKFLVIWFFDQFVNCLREVDISMDLCYNFGIIKKYKNKNI